MYKKIILSVIGIILSVISLQAQPAWTFVGPYSDNLQNGNGFATGQMTRIISIPIPAPGNELLFATSVYAGLWTCSGPSYQWTNIDMCGTDLCQANAIASVPGTTEIVVGNFNYANVDDEGDFSYSTRVSRYDYSTNTWTYLPAFSAGFSNPFSIGCVATDPSNANIVYAGTSQGLYRYSGGANWDLIESSMQIRSIVFASGRCYISGCTMAGQATIMYSPDPNNFPFNPLPVDVYTDISPDAPTGSQTEICGSPAGDIYALSVGMGGPGGEMRYLHKIQLVDPINNIYVKTFYTKWGSPGSYYRMPILYDDAQTTIWAGGMKLWYYNTSNSSFGIASNIHDDMHGLCMTDNGNLWVACDGGVYQGYNGMMVPMNDKLNVCLINGFSGSEKEPNIYAIGGQDITNSDIYDENQKKDRYTHTASEGFWENDGAFIYKHDGNVMFLDGSSYDALTCNSFDGGATAICLPSAQPYGPNAFEFGSQRTLQDPFRPGRVYQVGGKEWPHFYQFDFVADSFRYKVHFNGDELYDPSYGFPNHIGWQQRVVDMSFFPSDRNSVYLITSHRSNDPEYLPSNVIKYIGPNFDNCSEDNGTWRYADPPDNQKQWAEITPDFANFSLVQPGVTADIIGNDRGHVSLLKIETSPWNKNVIYVAGFFNSQGPNATVKVLKGIVDETNHCTWTNYSYGIPAEALVHTMTIDHYSNDALYVSTDKGVYYRDASMSNWIPYKTGLVEISAKQMEINYAENTVRVGTYGRGIWKSPLQCPPLSMAQITQPASGIFQAGDIEMSSTFWHADDVPLVLRGTDAVTLLPGFEATALPGATNEYFFALIHGCSGTGTSPGLYRTADEATHESTTSISQAAGEFKVYPNPGNGIYQVASPDEGFSVNVYNVQGALVKSLQERENETTVDISGLPPALYVFMIKTNNGTIRLIKVVKD
jgi:hypothetical protein